MGGLFGGSKPAPPPPPPPPPAQAVPAPTKRSEVEDKMKDAGMPPEEFRERIISQIPIGRMLQPKEIANIAVFLASSEADGMSGQAVTI